MTDECVEINCIMAILMTGAEGSSEITVHFYQTTWNHISEDGCLASLASVQGVILVKVE